MKIDDIEKMRSIFRKHMETAVEEIADAECQGELFWSENLSAQLANICTTVVVAAEECCVGQSQS